MKCKQLVSFALAISLMMGLLLICPTVPISAADNLAANGDLEMGSTNGWEIADAAVDSGVTYAGNYSLKLTATSAYSGAAYKIVPVGKGATVTVSFYYRYDSNPGSGKAYHVYTYKGRDANVGPYSNADKSLAIPSGCDSISTWQQVSYSFNSGDYTNIYLKFCPGGNGSGACYIDNLVVTATGGTEEKVAPYLTSFGTKYNRPSSTGDNLIKNGGFEYTTDAQWNTSTFIKDGLSVVRDSTTRFGEKSLCFDAGSSANPTWHTFPVAVEKYTQYTFSAWVKSPRLSANNNATATFGVANPETGKFLVYEPYKGNGHGAAILSNETMQLMATSPDGEWHLRSVTFYSGTSTTINVAVYGADSRLYLDEIALYKSARGVEYISDLRTGTITASNNSGNKYCADEHSLIPAPHMTGKAAENHWSDNPAWRNGFLSFEEISDSHAFVLKYTASKRPLGLTYVDWIDVQPGTSYTLTMDVKRLTSGGGRIALLDDNILNPAEFYTLSFSTTDKEFKTYSVTFNTGVYSRIGFAIVDGGGSAYIDKTRLFQTAHGVSTEPEDKELPALKPLGGKTSVMETGGSASPELIHNGGFETGSLSGFLPYQGTAISAQAAHSWFFGAHLKGDGSWGALIERLDIPVKDGATYTFSYWYKANSNGGNVTLKGTTTDQLYVAQWADVGEWTKLTTTFTVEGDTAVSLNICGGGNGIAEDLYLDDLSLREEGIGPDLGVAFLMDLDAIGATVNERYVGDLTNATVDVYGDGGAYKLVEMGALITNEESIGTNADFFKREHQDGGVHLVDVPALKLYAVTDTTVTYAVRLINIPYAHKDTVIYARPYYVFQKDGEEILVYGDIYSRSYEQVNP